MPYRTEFRRPHPGATWLEPVQVWEDPTPEERAAEVAAEVAYRERGRDLLERTESLIRDMKARL